MTFGIGIDAERISAAVQATATSRAWTAAGPPNPPPVIHLGDTASTTVDLS